MLKFYKPLLGIFIGMFLICFITYRALCNVESDAPVPVEYPESTLSDNLFVSQNSDYVEQEDLPVSYSFKDVPYVVDLPEGDTADVGSGHIVYGNDYTVFYVSQIDDTVSPHDAVLSQYPPVVYINYSQDASFAQTVAEDYGYLNGMAATYFVDHLLISTGSTQSARNAYVLGYCFDLGEEHPYNIIVSVATTQESTEVFGICKQLLDTLSMTVHYDEDLDKKQINEREKIAREQEKAAEQAAKEAEKLAEEQLKKQVEEAESSRVQSLLNEGQIPVDVAKDFKDLTIMVTWENEVENVTVTFENNDKSVYIPSSTALSKQALIDVGACKIGDYYIRLTKFSECGDIKVKLIENAN